MQKILTILGALAALSAAPAFAEGDAEAGKKAFNKCKSCHMVANGDEVIVKGGKTGPNLYGLSGRVPGSVDGFRYGDDLVAAGAGLPDGWTSELFVSYVADPRAWLRETLDDSKARSKMSFKLKSAEDAMNIWAFLTSVAPES